MKLLIQTCITILISWNCTYGNIPDIDIQTLEKKLHPVKEVAIVQLSFDGINTFHCGVGTVVLQTQTVLKELNQYYNESIHFKLYLISGDYSSQLNEYSSEILEKNMKDCDESGGKVYLIPMSKNDQMFGDQEQWQELCEKGAELCSRIINENKYTIIIAHDTAYAQLPYQLRNIAKKGKKLQPHKILWLPHATSWSYNGHSKEGIPNWPERHQWELEASQHSISNNYQIGIISPTLKKEITSDPFNVPESALISFRTGILLDKYLNSMHENTIACELSKRLIPLNKRLIFSIGRSNPLKGHDITLEVYRHLKNNYSDIHLVLLAPPSDYMPAYNQLLMDRIKNEQLDVTLINKFDPDLAHLIYQWPNTSLICLLSRIDTQPLTVMEARVNPKNSVILVSDSERMGRQVNNKKDGFICSLDGFDNIIIDAPCELISPLKEIVEYSKDILDLPYESRKQIIDEGKKLVLENYDLRKNMIKNLISLIEIED